MWSRGFKRSSTCFKALLGAGSGTALGLSLFASQKPEEKFSWKIEYPTERFDGVQLSRKVRVFESVHEESFRSSQMSTKRV